MGNERVSNVAIALTVLVHVFGCGVVVFLSAIDIDAINSRENCKAMACEPVHNVCSVNFKFRTIHRVLCRNMIEQLL